MERSEPTLVPEWLRSSGSVPGSGNSVHHHFASSSSHSDSYSSANHTKSWNSKSIADFDPPRSAFPDRSSSSNSRRSSSNGSVKHAYSSFSRSHRDKDRERDRERLNFGNHWDDTSDPFGKLLSRNEKDALRRSHSMVSRKPAEVFPRRFAADLKNGSNSYHVNGNGLISGVSANNSFPRAVFEKDFPSLGSEEKQGVPDIGRASSPGLSPAVQSLPVGSSALIGGEGWTSALAEVPAIIGNSSSDSSSTVQSIATAASGMPSAVASLNMAEALAQGPSRTRTAPQLSVQTQRLEELAIKQSRQLIPVTPSMPKSSVLNTSDKSKPKTIVRSGETNMAPKNLQQHSSLLHPNNQSLLGGNVKPDASKTSHGKLLVLKPGRENGISPSPVDAGSPTNGAGRTTTNQLAAPASAPSAPLKGSNNPKLSSGERKSTSLNLIPGFGVEKRPSPSQTQSRHDFFNLLKKKTSTNSPAAHADQASVASSPTSEKSCEVNKKSASPTSSQTVKNGMQLSSNGGISEEVSEEDAKFLRSLGWEENSGEDEGLTEEEINAFYQEVLKLKPSFKVCQGMLQKLLESNATGFVGVSSGMSSSESGSEI